MAGHLGHRLSRGTLDSMAVAVVVTDLDGTILYANPAAHRLYLHEAGALVGANAIAVLVPGEHRELADDIATRVRCGAVWSGEFPVRRGDGSRIRLMATETPLVEEGEVVGRVAVAQPAGDELTEAALVDRLVALAHLVADVAKATSLRAVADIVSSSAAAALGADAASLSTAVGHGRLRQVGASLPPGAPGLADRFSVEESNAASEAVRTRQVVVATATSDMGHRWPGHFSGDDGQWSLVALPLLVGERCAGALVVSFPAARQFSDLDHQYLGVLADSCAQAMDRLTATEAASAAATRLEFLAEASATLARSLDYEDTLRRVARLAIPTLADWCSIEVIEDGRLRPVAIRHTDPDKVALAQRLRDTFPPSLDDQTGAGAVARTGVTELIEKVDAEMLDALALEPQLRQMVDDLSLSSALTVALRARGRTLGVLSLVFAESGRRYTPDDLTFAEDLGRRAAVAIDNALLHTETSNAALELQRAVLPESFADSSSWQVAVHYQPAGRAHLVGGDFYDALTLPDGRLVALVGDVMGRGVAAAAAMAQIRSAVRAYLIEDPDPGEVVARLDRMFEVLDSEQLVTMMYALVAADATSASVVCAGHLPPVVVGGDGRSRLLPVPSTPPLGVGVTPRPPAVVALDPGDVVLAYTDGLVERRGEDIDVGVARLVAEAGCLAGGASNHALASLAQRLGHTGHDDDITVLAFRSAPRRAADELPEDDPS